MEETENCAFDVQILEICYFFIRISSQDIITGYGEKLSFPLNQPDSNWSFTDMNSVILNIK